MGVSTDGILFFGVDLGESPEIEGFDFTNEHEDQLAREFGWKGHHYEVAGVAWDSMPSEERYDNKGQEAALAKSPVEIVRHCSGDYPMYAVAVKGTVTRAHRGYPKKVRRLFDTPPPRACEEAHAWLAKHKVEYEELDWILCSMWW